MQEYSNFEDTEYISDAPTKLNKNMQSIITDFSGVSFPTANLFVGMKCLRTDENKVYRLYENASNQLVWELEYTIIDGGIKVKQADNASSATKATNDANNKAITSYVANVEVGSEQGKIKVTDGAGKLTEFTSYTIATQAEAEAGTNNVKAMTPKGVDYRLNKDRQLKTYTSLSQFGLTFDNSLLEIYNAMPNNSMMMVYVDKKTEWDVGWANWCYVFLKKNSVLEIKAFGDNTTRVFHRVFASWSDTGWKELATNGALSMPSNNSVSIDVNTTSYTAPADGYLYISYMADSETAIGQVFLNKNNMPFTTRTYGIKVNLHDYFPLAKGETVTITAFQATITALRFVYAQSEV